MSSEARSSTRKGAWPEPAQFNEAVQNLATSMSDAELQRGEAELGPLGVPMPYAGNFADVYKVHCPATGNTWALKFFKREVRDLRERYRAISDHFIASQLPFMVDFRYLDQGVRIGGDWYPIVKMRWVEGLSLNHFVAQALGEPTVLDLLFDLWVKLAARLRAAGIAHADLQHGNVVLVPEALTGRLLLKLIDYDGMFVPALADRPSGERGHASYQHPHRARDGVYSCEVDRFSHLAICCAVRCLRIGGRPLWERFNNGENLLFTAEDFAAPAKSPLLRELWMLRQPEVHALVGQLLLAATRPFAETPLLDDLLHEGRVRPLSPDEEQQARSVLHKPAAVPASMVASSPAPMPGSEPTAAAELLPKVRPVRRRQANLPAMIVLGASGAAVLAILLLVLWLNQQRPRLTTVARQGEKSHPKAAVEPPVEVDEPTVAKVDALDESTASPTVEPVDPVTVAVGGPADEADPDRELAQWAMTIGAEVEISQAGSDRKLDPKEPVPQESFRVVGLTFWDAFELRNEIAGRLLNRTKDLRHLEISFNEPLDLDLGWLAGMSSLESLRLGRVGFSGEGLAGLRDCAALRRLEIHRAPHVTAREAEQIAASPGLLDLAVEDSGLTDEGLEKLAASAHLRTLAMEGNPTSPAGPKSLESLLELESLAIGSGQVSAASLQAIASLPQLKSLSIDKATVKADWLAPLAEADRLTTLDIGNSQFDKDALQALSGISSLRSLRLEGANIKDHDLATLARLEKLASLRLVSDDITDKGLQSLKNCPALKSLAVRGSNVSLQGIEELEKALPGIEISYDSNVASWVLAGKHGDVVTMVAFSPDGKRLASASEDKTIVLWQWKTEASQRVLHGHSAGVLLLAFSPDGKTLASGDRAGKVILWDVRGGERRATLDEHRGGVNAVLYARDGKTLVTAGDSVMVRERNGKLRFSLSGHQQPVAAVALTHDAHVLFSAGGNFDNVASQGEVKAWDLTTRRELWSVREELGGIWGLALSTDGKRLAGACLDGTVRVWNAQTGESQEVLKGHTAAVIWVDYSPDGRWLASASIDGTVRLWDAVSLEERRVIAAHPGGVQRLAFAPHEQVLATCGKDHLVRIWRLPP